jgi:hypothetical protein
VPTEVVQLGVAGVVVVVVGYVFKLVVDGQLHTNAEMRVQDQRIADRDARITDLIGQVATLTQALGAANDAQRAILSLWKALRSEEDEDG